MKSKTPELLAGAILVAEAYCTSDCASYPLSLEVGNVTLDTGQIARGVVIGIGNPSQPMAFLPQIPLNNTFVYGTSGYCDAFSSGWSVNGCTTFRGGAYDSANSSTMQKGDAAAFVSATATDTIALPDLDQISDTTTLTSNFTVEDFPIGIALADGGQQGYYPQAALGLGSNSTLLSALVDSGHIASRTWSWFWGLNGQNAQLSGSLVLGGYDKAKVSGTGYTQAITTDSGRCETGLFVTLSDILVNMVEGTSSSIFGDDSQTLLAACIDPGYPSLTTIPLDPYFENFQTITNATITGRSEGLEWYNMRYNAGETPFDGDITLKFASGLSVRVDNAQYISPDVTINKTTGVLEVASIEYDVAMIALQGSNSNDILRIGRNFFSAACIMVNYDVGEFTIWAANPTESQDLVAVDSTGAELDNFCSSNNDTATVTAGGASPSNTDGTSKVTTTPSTAAKSNSSVPAIAGGVVGGAAGIACFSFIAWLLLRGRRKANQNTRIIELDTSRSEGPEANNSIHRVLKSKPQGPRSETVHELAQSPRLFHEMPSQGHEDGHANLHGDLPMQELPGRSIVHEMP